MNRSTALHRWATGLNKTKRFRLRRWSPPVLVLLLLPFFVASQSSLQAAPDDEMLTEAVQAALHDQCVPALITAISTTAVPGPATCIEALAEYGRKQEPSTALTILTAGQPDAIRDRYTTAAKFKGKHFWELVAGAHDSPVSCETARVQLRNQFTLDFAVLRDTSDVFHLHGQIAAMAYLLRATPPPATRDVYRGCFSVDPAFLFSKIDEIIGRDGAKTAGL